MSKSFSLLATITVWLFASPAATASHVLFVKALRDYDKKGLLGQTFRRELETRMFTHGTWRERLYINTYNPSKDETFEVYSKPDGSRWLSCKQAAPSLSQPILDRIWLGQKFDLKKELDASRVTTADVELPLDVANQIELLWQTMLPGPSKQPEARELHMDAPVFIAFARQNPSIKTGTMAFAAYHTPAYEEFLDIVNDLRKMCQDRTAGSKQPQKLSSKIRKLIARLAVR